MPVDIATFQRNFREWKIHCIGIANSGMWDPEEYKRCRPYHNLVDQGEGILDLISKESWTELNQYVFGIGLPLLVADVTNNRFDPMPFLEGYFSENPVEYTLKWVKNNSNGYRC